MTFKDYFLEKWYKTRKEPRNEPSDLGYFESENLIGKTVWVHTNRTNRDEGRNGMIGVYKSTGKGRTEYRYGYTNEITLGNVKFDANERSSQKISDTKKRTLVAGVIGNVIANSNDKSEYEPFTFNPFGEKMYFYLVNDPQKRKLVGAENAYFLATEDGKYITLARGFIFE